jgi:hypothetical protein
LRQASLRVACSKAIDRLLHQRLVDTGLRVESQQVAQARPILFG